MNASIILLKAKPLRDGSLPIYLRLSYESSPPLYIRLKGLDCHLDSWNARLHRFKSSKENFRNLNKVISKYEFKAESIISDMELSGVTSYSYFKRLWNKKTVVPVTVNQAFKNRIKQLKEDGKDNTADVYVGAYEAIVVRFYNNKTLHFPDITYEFLVEFENHAFRNGNKKNTIGNRLRTLRALVYEYHKLNDLPTPSTFKRFNVSRFKQETRKRSLTIEQFKAYVNYQPPNYKFYINAKKLFLLSFYCRGMNLIDLAQLKQSDIVNGVIRYRRNKTSREFAVTVSEPIKETLDYYAGIDTGTEYILPILRNDVNISTQVRYFNATLNYYISKIGDSIGVDGMSFYYARHTYADLARKSGVGIELISQALGHSQLSTTRVYLRGFETKQLDDITNQIINNL